MSLPPFAALPPLAAALDLLAPLAAGIRLGVVYFGSLRRTVSWFTAGGRTSTMIALTLGRFALLGGLLALASLEGALPLLTLALGLFIGRFVVMRGAPAP